MTARSGGSLPLSFNDQNLAALGYQPPVYSSNTPAGKGKRYNLKKQLIRVTAASILGLSLMTVM